MISRQKSLLAAPIPNQCPLTILQGEMWPNRCSAAIDEANSRLQELCEPADHLHFLDLGQVSINTVFFLPVALSPLYSTQQHAAMQMGPFSMLVVSGGDISLHTSHSCSATL